jgi:hypothetical protein
MAYSPVRFKERFMKAIFAMCLLFFGGLASAEDIICQGLGLASSLGDWKWITVPNNTRAPLGLTVGDMTFYVSHLAETNQTSIIVDNMRDHTRSYVTGSDRSQVMFSLIDDKTDKNVLFISCGLPVRNKS